MNNVKTLMQSDECLTMCVEDCAAVLGISRSLAYSIVERAFKEKQPFQVLRLGKTYRILKQSFLDYVYGRTEA